MLKKWMTKLENRIVERIAARVADRLDGSKGEFLPPVEMRGKVYMMTKRGEVWRMSFDETYQTERFEIVRR